MSISELTKTEQTAIAQFIHNLRQRFGQRLVLSKLYGSAARCERHTESDIDILILISALTWEEKRSVWDAATDINMSFDTILSPLVMTPEEFQTLRERELRIAQDIDHEGIAL